jgi:hypothetical protein
LRGGIAAERRILRLVRQGSWRFVDKLIPISEFRLSTLSRPVLRVLPDKSVMGQVVSRSPFAIDDTGAEALDRFTDFDPSRCPIASKRKPGASFLDRLLRGCRWPDQVRP